MRDLRMSPSAFLCMTSMIGGLLTTGCKREVADLRFRNFSNDTVRLTVAYTQVRWYPESGYDLSQRNAGPPPPVLVSGLGDSRTPNEHRVADSLFVKHERAFDSYLLPPGHTLWLATAQAGAGMPSSITLVHRGRSIQWTQDSIRSRRAETLSRDFH